MTNNTVYVIGAGASKEANLPTSDELKSKISGLLDIRFDWDKQKSGDYVILDALHILVRGADGRKGDVNPYLREAHNIRKALPQAISIDHFIDSHRGNDKIALCGKLAIVRSILEAEQRSLLYFERSRVDANIRFPLLEKTWYIRFFRLLTENCEKSDIEERFKSVALIIFNYDRCIEHFLYCALQNYYDLSWDEAAKLIKNISVYHPYGNVGTLPWANQDGAMEFGAEPTPQQLLELSRKIKTFTEGTNPKASEILEIRRHMNIANRLVFLGFAFHKLNMQLITPEPPAKDDTKKFDVKCFATTYEISDSDKEVIAQQIRQLYRGGVNELSMANSSCGDFFKEYWRSLAF
jgi:hypothetical protein